MFTKKKTDNDSTWHPKDTEGFLNALVEKLATPFISAILKCRGASILHEKNCRFAFENVISTVCYRASRNYKLFSSVVDRMGHSRVRYFVFSTKDTRFIDYIVDFHTEYTTKLNLPWYVRLIYKLIKKDIVGLNYVKYLNYSSSMVMTVWSAPNKKYKVLIDTYQYRKITPKFRFKFDTDGSFSIPANFSYMSVAQFERADYEERKFYFNQDEHSENGKNPPVSRPGYCQGILQRRRCRQSDRRESPRIHSPERQG